MIGYKGIVDLFRRSEGKDDLYVSGEIRVYNTSGQPVATYQGLEVHHIIQTFRAIEELAGKKVSGE